MRKIILLSSVALLFACNNATQKSQEMTQENPQEQPAIGGDRDGHGCLPSAGQTWSALKGECIQVFNEGERLNPIEVKENEAVISAFVLLNDDKSKVEIFTPENGDVVIAVSADGHTYQNDTFKYDATEGVLYIDNIKRYQK